MIEYKKLPNTMVVDCSAHGFGPFYVLIVPMEGEAVPDMRYFYLLHRGYGVVLDMFGCGAETDEAAAELAYYNAPDYIPQYIQECFDEE